MAESSRQPPDAVPKALIHKKILDAARDAPTASVEDVADSVSGATPELVANVLEEYGDPGMEDPETDDDEQAGNAEADDDVDEQAGDAEADDEDSTMTTDEGTTTDSADDAPGATEEAAEPNEPTDRDAGDDPGDVVDSGDVADPAGTADRASLSDAQIATLRAIHRNPEATQQELADELGVVRATISNRVNDVDGFDWERRRSFVEAFFDGEAGARAETTAESEGDDEAPDRSAADAEPPDRSAADAEPPDESTDADETETGSADSASDDASDPEQPVDDADAPPEQLIVQTASDLDVSGSDQSHTEMAQIETRLGELESTVAALEASLDGAEGSDDEAGDAATGDDEIDPELLHKAATAILEDDRIDEAEEAALLRRLL